jgi:hypothetical protein
MRIDEVTMSVSNRRLGKLEPMYRFILNLHAETRVSTCPSCEQQMHQRKVPLFIHVDPQIPVILGSTCRYCPECDLLVAHQDEIERLLAGTLAAREPSAIGNDYLVMGTVERKLWREGMKVDKGVGELLENLHDFKERLELEYQPAGWYRDEDVAPRAQARQGRESQTAAKPRKKRPKQKPGKGRS